LCEYFLLLKLGGQIIAKNYIKNQRRRSSRLATVMFRGTAVALEPSAAQITKSYFRRLPALERFYRETKFSLLKSTHSTQNLKTKLFTIQIH